MYVKRNQDGLIVALFNRPQYDGQEFVDGAEIDKSKSDYMVDCERLYASAMQYIQDKNGYTDNEVKTFARKAAAAHEYQTGSPSNQTIYFLAKIDAVVNGADPVTG